MAATQDATRSGSRIRQAPNVPDCTRSDGQPTTAALQVDLVVTGCLADLCSLSQLQRIGTAQLQSNRMLRGVEPQQSAAVAMQNGVCNDHFRVQQRTLRQLPMEKAAMAVSPIQHRCHGTATTGPLE